MFGGADGGNSVNNLFVNEPLVERPQLVYFLNQDVKFFGKSKVGHPNHPSSPTNTLELVFPLYLSGASFRFVLYIYEFLFNYRKFGF